MLRAPKFDKCKSGCGRRRENAPTESAKQYICHGACSNCVSAACR